MNQYLTVFLLCVSALCAANEPMGDKAGNGGDILAENFIAKGWVVFKILKSQLKSSDQNNVEPILTPEELVDFELALKQTRVEVVNKKLKDRDKREVSARFIEDPKRPGLYVIQLRRDRWKESFAKPDISVYRHVFHEYLNILKKDDKVYEISGRLDFSIFRGGSNTGNVTCGLSGSVDERIDDCAKPIHEGGFADLAVRIHSVPPADEWAFGDEPEYYIWNLVSRNEKKGRIWADMAGTSPNRLMWSDKSEFSIDPSNRYDAYSYCQTTDSVFRENSPNEHANTSFRWRAPTKQEIEMSLAHGLNRILPNLENKPFYYVFDTEMFRPREMAGAYLAPPPGTEIFIVPYGFNPFKQIKNAGGPFGQIFGRCVRNF